MPAAEWMQWSEVSWMTKDELAGFPLQLCDRLMQSSLAAQSADEFLKQQLPEIATEFSVQWAAVVDRAPQWTISTSCGRQPFSELPYALLETALDRDAGGFQQCEAPAGWSLIAVPLFGGKARQTLLLLAGRNLASQALPAILAASRTLSHCLDVLDEKQRNSRRIERLRSTLQIASEFASTRESQPLLELIAEESTRLLDCDRASIFIWDRDHHQLVACPALGVDGGTLRLPDNLGIVGEVVHSGTPARVDDCYKDPRFNQKVDKSSGYVTRNLLCWPLRNRAGELIGAFEVLNKNHDVFGDDDEESLAQLSLQAAVAIQNTRKWEQLIRSHEQLTQRVTQGVQIIGNSPAIVALRATIERLASTDLPVLILGESGTGKEVVAQALHFHGPRADQPFVAINCAALTETLLQSELFGHERGAFTDAHETRKGKFELAEGGTLFLDEIGDMSPGGQAKLLRVLEQKVITRVGGSQPIPIDVRIVAATNSDLPAAVRERRFREDLYYRLSVVTQTLPPLRDRPEDILPLAEHFLAQFCKQARRTALSLSAEARRRLQAHAWPGNVREVRNLMERVAFLSPHERVEADDLAFILSPNRDSGFEPSEMLSLDEATRKFQQEFIRRSIKRMEGNMSEAAKLLDVHRSNLYRKMRQLKMSEVGGDE